MIPTNLIDRILADISISIGDTIEARELKKIETEPAFTDRLVANIERDINRPNRPEGKIKIDVRTLKDKGPGSAEKKYGADIATVLYINLPNYKVKKGFLAQSKMLDNSEFSLFSEAAPFGYGRFNWRYSNPDREGVIHMKFDTNEATALVGQCEKMLKITPESFLFVYTNFDVFVCPAISIVSSANLKDEGFYFKNLTRFFKDYFSCFIGDSKVSDYKDETLEALGARFESRTILYFNISAG